jgi:hypothetical protein
MPDAQDVASVRSSEVAALDMAAELEADDPVFLPSVFWHDLNDKNCRMLEEEWSAPLGPDSLRLVI